MKNGEEVKACNEVKTYCVKDTDGESFYFHATDVVITITGIHESENGLFLYCNGKFVAHFLTWEHFRVVAL